MRRNPVLHVEDMEKADWVDSLPIEIDVNTVMYGYQHIPDYNLSFFPRKWMLSEANTVSLMAHWYCPWLRLPALVALEQRALRDAEMHKQAVIYVKRNRRDLLNYFPDDIQRLIVSFIPWEPWSVPTNVAFLYYMTKTKNHHTRKKFLQFVNTANP